MACQLQSVKEAFLQHTSPWARILLSAFGAAVLLRSINKILNRRALNNVVRSTFDWSSEIVVVTGGSGGIGSETVKRLAAWGTTVVVLDVIPPSYPLTDKVRFYKCNLMDHGEIESVAAQIRLDVGDPTVVVSSAGIYRAKSILDADCSDIELTFGINTLAVVWTAKVFLPSMVANNHGHFLIVASQIGYMATAAATDYSASKAATIAVYEGLHTELKHIHRAPKVRLSCINPSHVKTGMFTGVRSVPGMVSITPKYLVDVIEGILKSGQSQNIIVPFSAKFSAIIRALPDWFRVLVQDFAAGAFSNVTPRDEVALQATTKKDISA